MISDVNHLVIFLPQQIAVLHNVNVTLSMGQDSQLDQGLLWVCLYRHIYILYIYIYIYIQVHQKIVSHLAMWAGEISISIKLVSRRKYEVIKHFLVDGCVDCGLQKTQWTNTSKWHCTPNHHRLCKLNTELQATWAMSFSTLHPDSRTLFPNEIQNLLSSEKRTLDHWATVQFFSLAQVRRL